MPKVSHPSSMQAGNSTAYRSQSNTQTYPPNSSSRDMVVRQAAIENALNMALYFIRRPDGDVSNLRAATARANRALTLLKQASEDVARVGSAYGQREGVSHG